MTVKINHMHCAGYIILRTIIQYNVMHRQSMKKDREIERDRDMSYMQQARQ